MPRFLFLSLLMLTSFAVLATPYASQRVASARIVATARTQIDARLGSERAAANVTVVGTPEDMAVPAGRVTLSLHALTGRWPRSRIGVPVDVAVNGQVVRSATVWFALEVRREVLAYAEDAPIGTSGALMKLVSRDVDVTGVQGEQVRDAGELQGMRLRHPVLKGSVAVMDDFERVPDVDRQQRVRVLVTSGAIHMQARGTAISKGNAGDIVPVLVDNAEAPVRARVTDKGVVEVVQ